MDNVILTVEKRRVARSFNDHFASLVHVNQALNKHVYDHYRKSGLTYADVPEIVGITGACENVDTLYKVGNRLALPLFITQTGQLALEQILQSFHGAYTTIHSCRDEEEEDNRHLRQFRLTEEEFDCTFAGMTRKTYDEDKMYEALLKHIESAIKAMINGVLENCGKDLKTSYKRNTAKLREATKKPFLRITYEDAVKLLNENGFPKVRFGDDLKSDHEARVVWYLNGKGRSESPVIIMKYPKEIKFFNMKTSLKDSRLALSADLILPCAGEATGSAVREHTFSKLNERLMTSTMYRLHTERGGTYKDFEWYLNIMKEEGTNPHAGYGIGNERVLQYIFGAEDIRTVSVFSLLNRQTGDWDKSKYGTAAIVSPDAHKKNILITIGKSEHKKFLLPYLKKLSKADAVLYATKNTHEFLKKNGVRTSPVAKISDMDKTPNIGDLLRNKVFDLIINTPMHEKISKSNEFTDGKLIRKGAVETGVTLVTDTEVAAMVIENLAKGSKNALTPGPGY